jgi:hypothetical protein
VGVSLWGPGGEAMRFLEKKKFGNSLTTGDFSAFFGQFMQLFQYLLEIP